MFQKRYLKKVHTVVFQKSPSQHLATRIDEQIATIKDYLFSVVQRCPWDELPTGGQHHVPTIRNQVRHLLGERGHHSHPDPNLLPFALITSGMTSAIIVAEKGDKMGDIQLHQGDVRPLQ